MASKRQSSRGASIANPESPYYIHPNEAPVKVSPVLSGANNYPKWYRAMNAALGPKNKLGFVDGTIAAPAKDHNGAWNRCNKLVRSSIVEAVSPEIAEIIMEIGNAADIWRCLKEWYSPGDPIIISDLLKEIHSFKQGENQDVTSYFKEFSLLWKELEVLRPPPVCGCKEKCSCGALASASKHMAQDKVASFLKGLNEQFAAARSRIMRLDPLPSIDQVYASVLEETPFSSSASNQAMPETQPGEEEFTGGKKLDLPCHTHPLTLKPAGASYKCSGCGELGFGSSYCCESSECSYVLHEVCAKAVADDSGVRHHHPFVKRSRFMFQKEAPVRPKRFCDACGKDVKGFYYHCNRTGKDLHPQCLKLKDSISDREGHVSISDREGHVTLKLCKTVPKKCLKCKRKKVDNNTKGWSFVFPDEKNCYHIFCFKELIIEKYNEGFFAKGRISKQTYEPEAQVITLTTTKMVKVGESSSGSGTTKMLWKMASVAFKLIFSLFFGDPISLVLSLLEALVPNSG